MTFISTLIALIIERFFDWSHLRHWSWYIALERTIAQRMAGQSPYVILALTIIPILVLLGIIGLLLSGVLYGVMTLLFRLLILLYCLGPKNLWADGFACVHAMPNEFSQNILGTYPGQDSQTNRRQLLNNLFIEANRRLFAVIFWFAILGPMGAFLYRAITLSAQEKGLTEKNTLALTKSARFIETLLDWIPIRIFTFIFALGGHFSLVISYWRKNFKLSLDENEMLLTQCGAAALGGVDDKIAEDGSVEKNAISLLDRTFVMVLVIIAIGVLLV